MLKSLLINLRYWSAPLLALFAWLAWVIGWDGLPHGGGMHPVELASLVLVCIGLLMLVCIVLLARYAPDCSDKQ